MALDVDFWDDSVPKIIFFANVCDHRHRTAGATDAGSEATKHLA
jgi:hypothetical protein